MAQMITLPSMTTHSSTGDSDERVSFLDLPCELRLKIYHLIYFSSPVHHSKLSPWHVIPQSRTYIVQAVVAQEQGQITLCHDEDNDNDDTESRLVSSNQVRLLSHLRPLCRIPSSLLLSSRQIYIEARTIPFHENEFVFLDWFTSALNSALVDASFLVPWQRDALRYLRLEVCAADLVNDSRPFRALCGKLRGLEGMRLKINMQGGISWNRALGSGMAALVRAVSVDDVHTLVGERNLWIQKGLKILGRLSQLEVELVNVTWTSREHVEWCAKLQELLVAPTVARGVRVVGVTRLWPVQRSGT